MKFEFKKDGVLEENLDRKIQLDIFRIIQEQLNNILKHADATWISINLKKSDENIILTITDNGLGCDLSKPNNGIGISNIRNRAERRGGFISIASICDEGYELEVSLPLGQTDGMD